MSPCSISPDGLVCRLRGALIGYLAAMARPGRDPKKRMPLNVIFWLPAFEHNLLAAENTTGYLAKRPVLLSDWKTIELSGNVVVGARGFVRIDD